MTSPYQPFLNRFHHFKNILAPLKQAPHKDLEEVYQHIGVGWFKDNLLQIVDPIFIPEIAQCTNKLKNLENKLPIATNAFGDLFLLLPHNGQIEFFNFSNNKLSPIANSINELLNEKLFDLTYHSVLNANLTLQLTKTLGKLTAAEIYQPNVPILLGGEKKAESYKKSMLILFLTETIPIIQQWETLGLK
jgi:hypothetical protein